MGSVNIWLKRSYVGVTGLIVIICILLLGFTLFSHGVAHTREKAENEIIGLQSLYILSTVILLFAIFGGFGVWKQKKWALIVFAVGMILSSLFMLIMVIGALNASQLIKNEMKTEFNFLPLANASETELAYFNNVQKELQCCGLKSYKDWENNIPESCQCLQESTNPCLNVEVPRSSIQVSVGARGQPSSIYAKPCLPVLIETISYAIQTIIGIMWGLIILWVLSVGLCIAVLCQMNRKLETPTVAYSSEAKAGNYTTLTEAPEAD